jgi:hypothetical protein
MEREIFSFMLVVVTNLTKLKDLCNTEPIFTTQAVEILLLLLIGFACQRRLHGIMTLGCVCPDIRVMRLQVTPPLYFMTFR